MGSVNIQSLVIWIHGGSIRPCQNETAVQSVKKNCLALNKFICKRAEISDEVGFLASPVLDSGYPVNRFDRIFLSAMFNGKNSIDDIANFAWEITLSQGLRLTRENKIVESAEENISMFKNMIQDFFDNRLSIIKSLQII